MKLSISDKITLLNQTTLESFDEIDRAKIAEKFTKVGLKIFNADFGFVWFRQNNNQKYQLVYRTPNLPYNPQPPRPDGKNVKVDRSKTPHFVSKLKTKGLSKKYDVSPYLKSYAIIPVTYQSRKYGNVVLCFKKQKNFTKEEESLATALGNAAAQAMTINGLYFNLKDFKHTLDYTLDSIFIIDPKSFKITYVNRGSANHLGLSRSELLNKSIEQIIHSSSRAAFKERAQHIMQRKVTSSLFEITLQNKARKKLPAEILLQYSDLPGQESHLLGIVRDLTERKQSEEQVRKAAFQDTLTGLPNRLMFNDHFVATLVESENEKKKFSVMFLDLDRFKFINDILGHVAGDKLLREAANRLQQSIKKTDLVSRMGGDEFVVLLRNIRSNKDVEQVAQRIKEAFQQPFELDNQEVYINISIGISSFPADGINAEVLLKNADNALYRVKQQGGNDFQHYHEGIIIPQIQRMELEKQLRKGIKAGEFQLHYQPVYDLKTGNLMSAEALVRWNHPTMGLLMPGDFIVQAEESGLIVPLGEWVLREVCRQAKEWGDRGLAVPPISINISPRQLLQQDLPGQWEKILKEYSVSPAQIELELTETFLIKNMDVSIEILQQFRDRGHKIYIDDFGTGYASLNYLKRLPIDYIKIDQSFIHGLAKDPQDAGIIRAIISMAHHLDLDVVGEGVETTAQAEFLLTTKCNFVQGHFYSKPMLPKKFAKLLVKPVPLKMGIRPKKKKKLTRPKSKQANKVKVKKKR
jgi:diguanylate cyclase